MRFVVFGAGAIGGTIGGRLHQHGHDVVLIARGAHAEAIDRQGLRLASPDDEVVVDAPVVTHPSELTWADDDVVVLAMKSQHTEAALADLTAAAPATVTVVCAQNGVENERRALRLFADVQSMVVMCPAAHLEPGLVQVYSSPITGLLDVGRYPHGADATTHAIATALSASTFDSRPLDDVMRWKYGKLLLNLHNALDAVTEPSDELGELMEATEAEAWACFEAAGIAAVSAAEDQARRGDLLSLRRVGGERRGGGSTWQSLLRRSGDIETDHLNGEIVLLGRLHGVPTPANETLQRAAAELARTSAPPRSLAPADLLARYRAHPDHPS